MKLYMYLGLSLLFLVSCNKNSDIIDSTPTTNLSDSAKLILVESLTPNPFGGAIVDESIAAYAANKNKIWELLSTDRLSAPRLSCYFENSILLQNNKNELSSINAQSGNTLWQFNNFLNSLTYGLLMDKNLSTDNKDSIAIGASTLTLNNPTAKNTLLLLNKQNGAIIWSKPVSVQIINAPVLSNGKIFALTTNSNGTQSTLTAYDVATKNIIWQKIISNAFLTTAPANMILKGDTLVVGSSTNTLNLIDKNTGNIYWSKSFNTNITHLYKNKIVFNDTRTGSVNVLNSQTGDIILQSNPITATAFNGLSYVYEDAFYNLVSDTIYCTNLLNGLLKWKKFTGPGMYLKFITLGNKLYASKTYNIYTQTQESKLMILNAADFTAKDSINISRGNLYNFNIVSSENNKLY
jgi:outer membrane protein assembly factor BamB